MRKVIALMMFTLIALTAGAQTTQKKVYNEQSTPMGQNNKAGDNGVIAVGYPDEQPNAKPRDYGKIEFIK